MQGTPLFSTSSRGLEEAPVLSSDCGFRCSWLHNDSASSRRVSVYENLGLLDYFIVKIRIACRILVYGVLKDEETL
jgi:hypothetical protein